MLLAGYPQHHLIFWLSPLPFPSLPFPAPCLRLQKPHRKCCRRTGGSFRDGLNWPVIRPTTNTALVIFLLLLSEHSQNVTCLLSLKFLQSLCPSSPPLPLTTITETSITTTMTHKETFYIPGVTYVKSP